MVFSSPLFLYLFLPVVLGLYFLLRKELRNLILLSASLFFYAWGEQEFVLIVLVSIALNHVFGLLLAWFPDPHRRKLVLVLAVTVNIDLLAYYKYANFFADNLNVILATLQLQPIELEPIHLPLGISFFTLMNFPDQFAAIRQLYFYADSHNVANSSRRANLDEIDISILDKDDYIFVMYLPDEYRFVQVTRSYRAEKGLANLGIHGPVTVYTPESSPSLEWQDGGWPWLNLPAGNELNLPFKNPYRGPLWLAVFHLAEKGRSTEVEINGQPVGILTASPDLEPTWLNETLSLPPDQPDTIELKLRSVGVIPGNFARIGLFSQQQIYHVENSPALWWNNDSTLSIAPGTSLTLPFQKCPTLNCQLSLLYLSEPGRVFSIVMSDSQSIESDGLQFPLSNTWTTATVSLPALEVPILTFKVTGTLPVLIKEFSLR